MKRILFLSLLFTCLTLSAQTVTGVDANQVGKTIEITYHLDRTADISVDYSTDGGRTYKPLRHVSGDVGMSVTPGHKTITWDVLSEVDKFVGDNICFRVNATTDRGTANGHEWVDLGLSVKWATCNVGATKPEEYGNYYAWGETSPKSSYRISNYTYTYSSNPTTLPLNRDAVAVNWGGNWRMPTLNEIKELKEKCKWTWTVRGYTVTGPNGNSIFLPAAGYRFDSDLLYAGSYGDYWSSSLSADDSSYAYELLFGSVNVRWSSYFRYYGRSVRGVFSR